MFGVTFTRLFLGRGRCLRQSRARPCQLNTDSLFSSTFRSRAGEKNQRIKPGHALFVISKILTEFLLQLSILLPGQQNIPGGKQWSEKKREQSWPLDQEGSDD